MRDEPYAAIAEMERRSYRRLLNEERRRRILEIAPEVTVTVSDSGIAVGYTGEQLANQGRMRQIQDILTEGVRYAAYTTTT